MNTYLRSAFVLSSLVLLPASAFAMEPSGHDASMMQNGKMQSGMVHEMSGKSMQPTEAYGDKAFLSAMIPHHEAAVVMANDVLKNGKDSQVKKWAHEVIAAQQAEVKQMGEWLMHLGGTDKNAAKAMNDSMHTMMTSPVDKDADRNFVVMMIDHHASALEMSTKALLHSEDEKVIALAHQIIAAQAKEIMEYRQWLKKHIN